MRPPPSKIWFEAASRIARKDSVSSFTTNQEKVLAYLWDQYPAIYLGEPDQVHCREEIFSLSREMSQRALTENKKEMYNFLARGLEKGNLTLKGWKVSLSPVYIKINREKNFSCQEHFRPFRHAEKLIDNLGSSLKQPAPVGIAEALGQILVSAVLFGGLLNKKLIVPFQDSLVNRWVYQEGHIFWVDIEIKKSASAKADETGIVQHRLVPDPLTRLLIYRYLSRELTDVPVHAHSAEKNITAYLQTLPKDVVPGSLNELLKWGLARYLSFLPTSLVAYAAGKLKATVLPTAQWLRTVSGKTIPVQLETVDDSILETMPRIVISKGTNKSEQQKLLSDLLKRLRDTRNRSRDSGKKPSSTTKPSGKIESHVARRIIEEYLKSDKKKMSVTLQLLLHWGIRLLNEKFSYKERRQKESLKTVSVDRYLLSIGYVLLHVAGDIPLHKLDPHDLVIIYLEVSDRLERDPYAMQRLRQFHGFLRAFYQRKDIDWNELIEGNAASDVDANLVSAEVFHVVRNSLGWGRGGLSRWQALHILAFTLLYRCGMRPSELQALRLIDVQGITKFEILVRNTQLNNVKSDSGVRRLPLSEMLHKEELDFILSYYRMRQEEDRFYGDGLFLSHPSYPKGMLTYDELFMPIHRLLREVTKDERLSLYHLRHSLLSWANAVLLTRQVQHLNDTRLPGLAPEDKELIVNLFRKLASGNELCGRNGQYLLAMLAGHATPETTNRNYCHLHDLVLGLHLSDRWNCIPLNYKSIMSLAGLESSAAFEYLKSYGSGHPLHKIVSNESLKFKEMLQHSMMKGASKIKQLTVPPRQESIPPWEEAIEGLRTDKRLMDLRRSRVEWEIAAGVYEAIRAMDGRRIKTAQKVIAYARINFDERWGGISFSVDSQAKLLMALVKECKQGSLGIVAVLHPKRNDTAENVCKAKMHWGDVLGIPSNKIAVGEAVPIKKSSKSVVTVKVTSQEPGRDGVRGDRMSQGFKLVVDLLHDLWN